MDHKIPAIEQLKKFIQQLRDKKQGCPWIINQTFASMADLTIEESYEFAESVLKNNFSEIKDELSDLLLHIVLYAQIASELNEFNFEDLAYHALEKQRRRKINFPDPAKITAEEALRQWDAKKLKERQEKDKSHSAVDSIPYTLPTIKRSYKLQKYAAQAGFDWPSYQPVFDKINEECEELKEAIQHKSASDIQNELGDLMFSVINLSRHLKINPETALRHANQKFEKRFRSLEKNAKLKSLSLSKMSLEDMEELWKNIKSEVG